MYPRDGSGGRGSGVSDSWPQPHSGSDPAQGQRSVLCSVMIKSQSSHVLCFVIKSFLATSNFEWMSEELWVTVNTDIWGIEALTKTFYIVSLLVQEPLNVQSIIKMVYEKYFWWQLLMEFCEIFPCHSTTIAQWSDRVLKVYVRSCAALQIFSTNFANISKFLSSQSRSVTGRSFQFPLISLPDGSGRE